MLADGGADLASNCSSVLILIAAAPMPTASSLPLLPSCHDDDRALLLLSSESSMLLFLNLNSR